MLDVGMNQKRKITSSQLEDVSELIQHIQLQLPVKEAARTSVLSKSWLHAWSTIPTLRFRIRGRKHLKLVDMDRTLIRYLHDDIPIETFDLDIDIDDKNSSSLVEKCIRTMSTRNHTLKELSLSFHLYGVSVNLPHEILSCENLTTMRVMSEWRSFRFSLSMNSQNPVIINCVSLRELYLNRVNVSQELLDGILSSCRSLVKIDLINSSEGLNTIKVKNLPCLYQLRIVTEEGRTALEIDKVPNLRVFAWGRSPRVPFNAHSISLGNNLKHLTLSDVATDNASLDVIKSGAPFLESLTIEIASWSSASFNFTCDTLKRLFLLSCGRMVVDVKVYAPNLLFFGFDGETMPSVFFPLSSLINQTAFWLDLAGPVDASFFVRMGEALALTSNCDIRITTFNHGQWPPMDIDINYLRLWFPFPTAMNVNSLIFETRNDECMWDRSRFFDAFFEICHPKHVTAMQDRKFAPKNHFCKVMLMEVVLEKENTTTTASWSRYLKNVQINRNTKWETLTSSHKSFLEGPTPVHVDFKLEWR